MNPINWLDNHHEGLKVIIGIFISIIAGYWTLNVYMHSKIELRNTILRNIYTDVYKSYLTCSPSFGAIDAIYLITTKTNPSGEEMKKIQCYNDFNNLLTSFNTSQATIDSTYVWPFSKPKNLTKLWKEYSEKLEYFKKNAFDNNEALTKWQTIYQTIIQ